MSAPAWIAFAACSGTDPELFFAEDWRDSALCAEVDGELFFPERGSNSGPAKRICAKCPVRQSCLEYALEHEIVHGVWGGLAEHERREIRRQQRQEAA